MRPRWPGEASRVCLSVCLSVLDSSSGCGRGGGGRVIAETDGWRRDDDKSRFCESTDRPGGGGGGGGGSEQ